MAVVAGRVRSCPAGSLIAAESTTSAVAMPRSTPANAFNLAGAPTADRDLPLPNDVEHRRQVHVDADRRRRVASGQPRRRDEHVVGRCHASSAEHDRDRRDEEATAPEGFEVLGREGAVAVVVECAGGELLGVALGSVDHRLARFGRGLQLRAGGEVGGRADRRLVERARSGAAGVGSVGGVASWSSWSCSQRGRRRSRTAGVPRQPPASAMPAVARNLRTTHR